MIPMCILNDDLLGFEYVFGLGDLSPSSAVHYVSPQVDRCASPPVRALSSIIQAQDTTQPETKPISYDILEGHIFPTPDQVHPNDAIFKVVKAEVHREHSDDFINANGKISDRVSSTSSYSEQDSGGNESITDEISSVETYTTGSGTDEEGSEDENLKESQGIKPSKSSINEVTAVEGASVTSISATPVPKVVGYVSNPNLATMKFTNAGKVWLWDRPEDILVIKEDGRIIDPASTARKRNQKSYQQQVKLSAGKLYGYFFSKKTSHTGNKRNWGTTSLDRRAVMNASQAKRDFHVSLSSYEILSSNEK